MYNNFWLCIKVLLPCIKALIPGRDQHLLHIQDATGKKSDRKTNQTEVEMSWSARKMLLVKKPYEGLRDARNNLA